MSKILGKKLINWDFSQESLRIAKGVPWVSSYCVNVSAPGSLKSSFAVAGKTSLLPTVIVNRWLLKVTLDCSNREEEWGEVDEVPCEREKHLQPGSQGHVG